MKYYRKLQQRPAVQTDFITSRSANTQTESVKQWSNKCIIKAAVIVMCIVTTAIIAILYASSMAAKGNGI